MNRLLVLLAIIIATMTGTLDGTASAVENPPTDAEHYTPIRLECIDPQANARFGHAVDLDGEYLVVGTCYDEPGDTRPGRVYVYRQAGRRWAPCARLQPGGGDTDPWFGWSVSISGSRVLVGTRGGPAYLFNGSGGSWKEECRLAETSLAPDDQFGWSVSLDGDLAVVGSWADAAWVYRLTDGHWGFEGMLEPPAAAAFSGFGTSVAVDREIILVGAPMDSAAGHWAGAAFVFSRDGDKWVPEGRLNASGTHPGEGFGKHVALQGQVALVSAPDAENHAGSCCIFRRSGTGWVEEAWLDTGCTRPGDLFGGSISIDGDCAVVGACGVGDDGWWGSGTVHVFSRRPEGWQRAAALTPPKHQKECFFGYAVALDGKRILVGAHCQDCPKAGENAGTAYVFEAAGP